MWPAWILWAFDHVCRWLRYTILTNFHAPNASPADLELITDDAVRVTVRRWVPFGWRAGQHMFISMPHIGPIESHPFTIATLPEGNGKVTEMVFIIRLRQGPKGFTHRLREYILAREGSCRVPIFLDGPYGSPPDITAYSTCVLIAGKHIACTCDAVAVADLSDRRLRRDIHYAPCTEVIAVSSRLIVLCGLCLL